MFTMLHINFAENSGAFNIRIYYNRTNCWLRGVEMQVMTFKKQNNFYFSAFDCNFVSFTIHLSKAST